MVDTELYKLFFRHLYTLIMRLILSYISFNNGINLNKLDNNYIITSIIQMRFKHNLNIN